MDVRPSRSFPSGFCWPPDLTIRTDREPVSWGQFRPFPNDVALKELAETRLKAAENKLVIADPTASTLRGFWRPVLAQADEGIKATLDREVDLYGPKDE